MDGTGDFGEYPILLRFGNIFDSTAGVEGTHSKLRAGFTDGLCGDDSDGFADIDEVVSGEVVPVAFGTNAFICLAGKHGTHFHYLYPQRVNLFCCLGGYDSVRWNEHIAALRVEDILGSGTSTDFEAEIAALCREFLDAIQRMAIFGRNANILCYIHKSSGEVP